LEGASPEGSASNVFQIRSKITDSSFGKDGEELFDISIIRLSDLSGALKDDVTNQNSNFSSNTPILVNSTSSNTEANSKTIFNGLINNGIFSSPFNVINITPQGNCRDIGVSPKNVSVSLSNLSQAITVYSLDGASINNQFTISNLNDLYYAGVPVLANIDSLSITIGIPDLPTQTKTIKVWCYNGEDLISSAEVKTTEIKQGVNNNIVITLKNITPKNYYTYADSYNIGSAITTPSVNQQFWKFNDPKNLAFAHLSAKKALGNIPKYNFHIQALELSIVITY
jgi:hypothetical protein